MNKKLLYLLILSTLNFANSSLPPNDESPNYLKSFSESSIVRAEEDYKLGDETKPSYYKIVLAFNETDRFHGNVEITFEATQDDVKTVWLSQEDLTVDAEQVEIYQVSDKTTNLFKALNQTMLNYQKIGFELSSALTVGEPYLIKIHYVAVLYDESVMRGVYRSNYKENGKQQVIYTTHFGQQARRMMPCWDENRFKAQFEFTIYRDTFLHSKTISNARRTSSLLGREHFAPTAVLSPYLLALVISNFEINENGNFALYARPEAMNQTDFALEVGVKLLEALDTWTNMPYYKVPGATKMAIAAIPDFSAGAMENFGLLLHREVNVLFDEKVADSLQKQKIALVIAHELAHMWFGDIVTCNFFSETWLNEGFARYFQYIALEMVDKSYDSMRQFAVTTLQASMQPDSASTAHALTEPGKYSYPNIRTMFDSITYDKGASILRMAHNLMGDAKFQNAIRAYLEKRKFATAVPEDLFTEMEREYAGITDILGPYTQQAGFPLVTAIRDGDKITLTQKRFLSESIMHNDKTRWNIPITVATKEDDLNNTLAQLTIFDGGKDNLTFEVKNFSMGFYLLNVHQFGYYRVNYDLNNWQAIGNELKSKHETINAINRAQIIDDLFNLAKVGYLEYDFIFNVISYVKKDRDYLPWLALSNGLAYLEQRIPSDPSLKSIFDAFVNDILSEIYDENETLFNLHRILVLQMACKYQNEKCLSMAANKTEQFMKGESLPPNEKTAVYCTAVRESENSTEWNKLKEMYVSTNYATEQGLILTALGCSTKAEDINKFMDMILTDDIRHQDKSAAFKSAYSGNPSNVDTVLKYILENEKKWSETMSITSTLSDLSARFVREDQFDTLDEYIKENENPQLEAASKKNRELLKWDKERLQELNRFFRGSSNMVTFNAFLSISLLILSFLFQ
ncbi:membrane alanyl aminopeptidase-like [Culicoides brevitarsis]|uniref:membrane alanyl aminopeptidase-like n=1 Tax=Culicoides brevitarsis TaxID=469753 RepID=UPI00307B610E